MQNNPRQPLEDEEHHLWRASRSYMKGDISVRELEDIERPHTQDLRKAFIALATPLRKRVRIVRRIPEDESERYLWMSSRLYMSGDLSAEQLEANELPHTQKFNKANIILARWLLWQRFLTFLHIGRKPNAAIES